MAKLTEETVLEIRMKYAESGLTFTVLGKLYGIGHKAVWDIVHYKIWKNVSGPAGPSEKLTLGENSNLAKLTTEQVLAIRAEYAAGNTDRRKLGTKYGIGPMGIYHIVKRHTWKHI